MPKAPIYLDYHATTPVDPRVREVLIAALDAGPANPHSASHRAGWQAHEAVENARVLAAELIGARADEIVFTSGASEASNLAILGAAAGAAPGRILISAIEHPSVVEAARAAADRYEHKFEILPVSRQGVVDPDVFEAALADDLRLVSVMLANNEIGTVQPVGRIGALCRQRGIVFHCDGAQGAGRVDVDIATGQIDLLSLSGHKMHGPMGIGALFVRGGVDLSPQMFGGAQEAGLRPGTVPAPLVIAFGEACRLAGSEGLVEQSRIATMRDRLLDLLAEAIPGLVVNGGMDNRLAGNLNVSLPGTRAEDILLAVPGIAASTGSACASGTQKPSPVLKALGLDGARVDGAIRFGIGRFTTDDEIAAAAGQLIAAFRATGVSPAL